MPLSQHVHAPETNGTCRSQDLQGNLDTDEMDNSEGVQAFSPEARLGDADRSHHQAPKVRRQPIKPNRLGVCSTYTEAH